MKFGKDFSAQMVQEWQEAYMDYKSLKTALKVILRLKQRAGRPAPTATAAGGHLNRRVSLYRAFSGLADRNRQNSAKIRNEDDVILVRPGQEDVAGGNCQCQTIFLKEDDGGTGEYESAFFQRLDNEFNRVSKFYRDKVEEMMREADELSKQMRVLIALRIKVDNPVVCGAKVADLASNFTETDNLALQFSSVSHSQEGQHQVSIPMEAINENINMSESETSERNRGGDVKANRTEGSAISNFKPAPLQVLDNVKINLEPETPLSMLELLLRSSKPEVLFCRNELEKAEGLMMQAIIEYHQKLRCLKSFSFQNQLALCHILKKYDKVTSRNASKAYLHMVDNSYLGRSDKITRLMERVEETFTRHFANGNHKKAMAVLRPQPRKASHFVTFFYGLFSGCSIALIATIAILVHMAKMYQSPGRNRFMENIFPLYSLFGYVVLHLLMFAGNVYFWKRYRVNYLFIFGIKQGKELGYREILLLSSALSVVALGGVLSHLDMDIDPRTKRFETMTELIPLVQLIVLVAAAFCPFNIMYRSSRFFLIRCFRHCLLAPFYKVTLPDFFLADQLTSQVQALRSLEFYVCYYGWGDFTRRSNTCSKSDLYKHLYLIVAIIPYWMRLAQCLRRLRDEKDSHHILNGLKYLSTIVAVALRTIYEISSEEQSLLVMATIASFAATIINTYWDLVMDWGLLRRNSKNPWLRDKLLIRNKSVYFVAMVVNVCLRLAWMKTVLGIKEAPFLHRTALVAVVSGLEIVRRGIWNFFRLENEHLNNVGKFRAFKSVPLPFYHEEGDGGKLM